MDVQIGRQTDVTVDRCACMSTEVPKVWSARGPKWLWTGVPHEYRSAGRLKCSRAEADVQIRPETEGLFTIHGAALTSYGRQFQIVGAAQRDVEFRSKAAAWRGSSCFDELRTKKFEVLLRLKQYWWLTYHVPMQTVWTVDLPRRALPIESINLIVMHKMVRISYLRLYWVNRQLLPI